MILFADIDVPVLLFYLVIAVILAVSFAEGKGIRDEAKARKRAIEEMKAEQRRKEAEEAARKRQEEIRLRDAKLKRAMEELENDTYDRTLWAKALIMADGSQSKAKALYLRLRIGEL